MARFVALGIHGLLQPRNRFIKMAEFNHVGANVVVRIAKIGVNLNRASAFSNRIFQLALEVIGPAQKSVRLRRGVEVQ